MKENELNKELARLTVEAFGCEKKKINRLWDENNKVHIDILTGYNAPTIGLNAFATISLSNSKIYCKEKALSFGLELLGVCDEKFDFFINVMATAAFCLTKSKWTAAPGTTIPDVIHMYDDSCSVRHLLICSPFLWSNKFKTQKIHHKTITWLMIVPITEKELQFAEYQGAEKLEEALEQKSIDIADLNRPNIA